MTNHVQLYQPTSLKTKHNFEALQSYNLTQNKSSLKKCYDNRGYHGTKPIHTIPSIL